LIRKSTKQGFGGRSASHQMPLQKMGKDQPVSVEALAKICRLLDCTVDDIIEFLPDDVEQVK